MKFNQISFKSLKKLKSKRKKAKESQSTESNTSIDENDNVLSFDTSDKYVITNSHIALSEDEDESDNSLLYELGDIDEALCSIHKEQKRGIDIADLVPDGANLQDFLYVTIRHAKRLSIINLLDEYLSEETSDLSNGSMKSSDKNSCSGSDKTNFSVPDSTSYSKEDGSDTNAKCSVPVNLRTLSCSQFGKDQSIVAGYSNWNSHSTDADNSEAKGEVTLTLVDNNNHVNEINASADCDLEITLSDIRNTFQEEVNSLRAEKNFVEEKICGSEEDDKMRHKETQLFRKHLPVYKKQVLLKTLNSLKERLETQSQRLQKSYTAVLSMQRRFTNKNNPLFIVPNIH